MFLSIIQESRYVEEIIGIQDTTENHPRYEKSIKEISLTFSRQGFRRAFDIQYVILKCRIANIFFQFLVMLSFIKQYCLLYQGIHITPPPPLG